MTISISSVEAREPVLRVVGDLDLAVREEVIASAAAVVGTAGLRTLVLDLSGVGFIDSCGIGALVIIRELCHGQGADLQLTGVLPKVHKVLALTGLLDVFGISGISGDASSSDQIAVLQNKIRNLEFALESNRRVALAAGILVSSYALPESDAFTLLLGASQRCHRKVRDLAEDVILTGTLDQPR